MTHRYLLDANVFIEPAKKYYAFALVPKYWDYLCAYAEDGTISSIDKVKDELRRDSQLVEWANTRFPRWESTRSDEIIDEFKNITEWFKPNQHYTESAKALFADRSKADAWVIAYAKINNYTVVTDEHWNSEKKKKIPIPNACELLGVEWIGVIAMLHSLGIVLSG